MNYFVNVSGLKVLYHLCHLMFTHFIKNKFSIFSCIGSMYFVRYLYFLTKGYPSDKLRIRKSSSKNLCITSGVETNSSETLISKSSFIPYKLSNF